MANDEGILAGRGRALEESFFAKHNEKMLERLREEAARQAQREALAEHSGITSEAILDKLIAAGVTVERVTALALVPLVEVAWADGTMSSSERKAILKAAAERGIASDSADGELLADWLDHRPGDDMIAAWAEYVGAVTASLTPEERDRLKHDLLDRAGEVAEAAGGFLGIGTVSPEERRRLEELEKAFD